MIQAKKLTCINRCWGDEVGRLKLRKIGFSTFYFSHIIINPLTDGRDSSVDLTLSKFETFYSQQVLYFHTFQPQDLSFNLIFPFSHKYESSLYIPSSLRVLENFRKFISQERSIRIVIKGAYCFYYKDLFEWQSS